MREGEGRPERVTSKEGDAQARHIGNRARSQELWAVTYAPEIDINIYEPCILLEIQETFRLTRTKVHLKSTS